MSVFAATSVITQQLELVCERSVIRRNRASLPVCTEVLRRLEAETCRSADRSHPAIPERGAVCLAGIFDHHQPTRCRNTGDDIQVSRLAIEIDNYDGLGARSEAPEHVVWIQVVRSIANIAKNRRSPDGEYRFGRGNESVNRNNHLIAAANAEGTQGQFQCGGARRQADTIVGAYVGCELVLKSRNVRFSHENSLFQHAGNGAVDFIMDRAVLPA